MDSREVQIRNCCPSLKNQEDRQLSRQMPKTYTGSQQLNGSIHIKNIQFGSSNLRRPRALLGRVYISALLVSLIHWGIVLIHEHMI